MGNPTFGHVKRREVALDDGWTIITHSQSKASKKKGKRKSGRPLAQDVEKLSLGSSSSTPNNAALKMGAPAPVQASEGFTVAGLVEEYEKMRKRWEESECREGVEEMLIKRQWDVKNALCFGIGSFSSNGLNRLRSMWQLILFLFVVEVIGREGRKIKMYAQEPCFNRVDKGFMKELGIEVLGKDAEKHVNGSSFIYSPFVDWKILLPLILKDANPSLYVGNEILDDYTFYASDVADIELKECNEAARCFLARREGVKIPTFEIHGGALQGMMVYWKKEKGTPEA